MNPNLRWQVLLAGVGLALVLALLSFQVQTAALCTVSVPANGGTIVEGMVGRPVALNPLFSEANPVDRDIAGLIFDGLTQYDDRGNLVPALARVWTVSDDRLSVQFELREDALWHDGTPVTAADVTFTYGLLQEPDLPISDGLRQLWQSVEITGDGDRQVTFTLPAPYAPFLAATTRGLLPAHILADIPPESLLADDFNRAPIGTGPFAVADGSWVETGRLRLNPFPPAWPQGTRVDGLEIRFFPSTQALKDAYVAGELLALHQLDPGDLLDLAALTDLRLFTSRQSRYVSLVFNVGDDASPTADRDVRQALALGIDREALIARALIGQAVTFSGPFPPESWAYDPGYPAQAHDPAGANNALASAGWTVDAEAALVRDSDGQALTLRLLFGDTAEHIAVAREMQAQWQRLGVTTVLQPVPLPDLTAELDAGDFDVALVSIAVSRDPDLYDFWSQEAIVRGQNYGGWNNRRASEALEAGRQTWDRAGRLAEYRRFARQFAGDLPAVSLYQPITAYGISAAVQAVEIGRVTHARNRYQTMAGWHFLFRDVTVPCPD